MGKRGDFSVSVLTNVAGASGRDQLAGVFRYVNTGRPWRIRLLNSTDEMLREIAQSRLESWKNKTKARSKR